MVEGDENATGWWKSKPLSSLLGSCPCNRMFKNIALINSAKQLNSRCCMGSPQPSLPFWPYLERFICQVVRVTGAPCPDHSSRGYKWSLILSRLHG